MFYPFRQHDHNKLSDLIIFIGKYEVRSTNIITYSQYFNGIQEQRYIKTEILLLLLTVNYCLFIPNSNTQRRKSGSLTLRVTGFESQYKHHH